MLFDDRLRDLLSAAQSIAIVGAKDRPGSPVEHVGRYLLEAGYRIFPVHPVRREVWGLPAFRSLGELPASPDVVCLFRAPQYCPEHAREVLTLTRLPLLFWMQEGIRSPEAGQIMADAGVPVVEDMCMETVHRRLFPSSSRCFSCRRCGHCCSGRGGIVVGPRDLLRLADFFRMSAEEFLERHTENMRGKTRTVSAPFFHPTAAAPCMWSVPMYAVHGPTSGAILWIMSVMPWPGKTVPASRPIACIRFLRGRALPT